MRRKCLELLSEPDLKKIAGNMFKKSVLAIDMGGVKTKKKVIIAHPKRPC